MNTANLTLRERQMLNMISDGMSNRDIAKTFGITEGTVKNTLVRLFDKTGMGSRLELAVANIKLNYEAKLAKLRAKHEAELAEIRQPTQQAA